MSPLRATAAALALALACADPGPGPRLMAPDHGPAGVEVRVVVSGDRLDPRVTTDFAHAEDGAIDPRFTLQLGGTLLRDVQLRPDGALEAVVPETLDPGTYDLAVTRPDGQRGTLAAAYRALAPGALDDVVARLQLELTSEPRAGEPFQVTITALDAQGDVAQEFGGAALLSDATGTAAPARAALFDRGVWTGAVEIRAPSASDVLTAALPSGAQGTSSAFAVAPAPAVALAFAGAPLLATAGTCSGAVTVVLADRFGDPTVAATPVPLVVDAAPAAGLFADAACQVPLDPELAPWQPELVFHVLPARAGTLTLSVSAGGLAGAQQQELVSAGAPAQLVFPSPLPPAVAGACTATAVEVQDALGNPVAAPGLPVAIVAAPAGGFALYQDVGCTAPLAAARTGADGSAPFAFIGVVAWPVALTASSPGLSSTVGTVAVTAGPAVRVAFVGAAPAALAGCCSPALAIQAQDALGNAVAPLAPVALALTVSPGGAALFADAACTVPVTGAAVGPGAPTVELHLLATSEGVYRITATAGALAGDAVDATVTR